MIDARCSSRWSGYDHSLLARKPPALTSWLLIVASLGSRSQGGERAIERLLSVDQTCRLQRRSLYAYLSDALTPKSRGDSIPALA